MVFLFSAVCGRSNDSGRLGAIDGSGRQPEQGSCHWSAPESSSVAATTAKAAGGGHAEDPGRDAQLRADKPTGGGWWRGWASRLEAKRGDGSGADAPMVPGQLVVR